MPQLLRITFQREDNIFHVMTDKPFQQTELELFYGGQTYYFRRDGSHWKLHDETTHEMNNGLFEAIGKALALRYRVSSAIHSS